jgi:hypothetical protein
MVEKQHQIILKVKELRKEGGDMEKVAEYMEELKAI